MKHYLLSIVQPDGPPPPAVELQQIMERVGALTDEMRAAGALVYTGGLHPPSTATVVRAEDGATVMTDGPFAESKEHIGGLLIVAAPDLDAALEWARRTSEAVTLPIEVRPFRDQ
jgi:hypothetical protein